MFLNGQHQDSKHKLSSAESLDEDALCERSAFGKSSPDVEGGRKHDRDQICRETGRRHLCYEKQDRTDDIKSAENSERQCDLEPSERVKRR